MIFTHNLEDHLGVFSTLAREDFIKNPKISVVMSVYNGGAFLKESIESILNQSFKDFEFLIVNDYSSDSSEEIMKRYLEVDRRIKLIRNNGNQGLARSLNRALKLAQGEYIARMDADDVALTERLELQKQYLEQNQDIDLVGSKVIYIDDKNKNRGENSVYTDPEFISKVVKYDTVVYHPTFFFRKRILEVLHGYRELPYVQDYDFIIRLHKKGFKVSNVDKVLLYYRLNTENFKKSLIQRKLTMLINELIKKDQFDSFDFSKTTIFIGRLEKKFYYLGFKLINFGKKIKGLTNVYFSLPFFLLSTLFSPAIRFSYFNKLKVQLLYVKRKLNI